jgi:hypothetical protein
MALNFRPRYELHTEFGIIEGSYEDLISLREKQTGAILYELIPSSMNKVRISRVSYITLGQYLYIHVMHKRGKVRQDFARQFNLGWNTIVRILKDEFNILQHGNIG